LMSGSVQWTEITSLVDYTICGPQIKLVLDGPCWSVAAENLKKSPKYQRTVGYPSTSWASCSTPNGTAIFRRKPPERGRRMQGAYKKITILDQYLALSRKRCKIDGESETAPKLSNGTSLNDLE